MCGRFTLTKSGNEIASAFGLDMGRADIAEIAPRYNIAPSQPVAIIRADAKAESSPDPNENLKSGFMMSHVVWGLIPFWAKDPKIAYSLINARAETVAEKPSFKAALKYRRCLIPADGFYEWRRLNDKKQPFYFRLRDRPVFAFAGLWEHWQSADGSEIESCTIITTTANDTVKPVHERMPVILQPQDYETWLDPALQQSQLVTPLLQPFDPNAMECYPVSTAVNSPRYDQADCIQPLDSLDEQ